MLKVNYGINRRVGRHIEHRNGKLCVAGDFSDRATHLKIRDAISRRHPGWNLTGYAERPAPTRRHVIMCQSQFVPKIEAGTKLHTMRPPRVRAIQPGDVLDLRAWTGKPYRSTQEKVLQVTCASVCQVEIHTSPGTVWLVSGRSLHYGPAGRLVTGFELIDFAQRDGFTYTAELFAWFEKTHGRFFNGQLIEWRA